LVGLAKIAINVFRCFVFISVLIACNDCTYKHKMVAKRIH